MALLCSKTVLSLSVSSLRKSRNQAAAPSLATVASSQDSRVQGSGAIDSSCIEKVFDLNLPEGRCVGMNMTESAKQSLMSEPPLSIRSLLHPGEVAFGMQASNVATRSSFLLGRAAVRQALEGLLSPSSLNECVLLKDEHGRPSMPQGFMGSISHKGSTAVGLVCPKGNIDGATSSGIDATSIGVDLERCDGSKSHIMKRVLTENELSSLGQVDGLSRDEEVLLRFSVKEALYKAMHPLICQFVGFQEAETWPLDDGSVHVGLNLKSGAHESFGLVQAHWRRIGNFFLTSARVELKGPCKGVQDVGDG